ncbi:MAG: hypothetical protein OXI46_11370 [Gemmatimonadota bacterium]|nr:hypothetical protein [Gemmatimonadota bacterium]
MNSKPGSAWQSLRKTCPARQHRLKRSQIRRQGVVEAQPLAMSRMVKAQDSGMKRLAREAGGMGLIGESIAVKQNASATAPGWITDERMKYDIAGIDMTQTK